MTRKSDKARDQQVADETMNGTDQVADGEREENVAAADAPETDLAAELARVTEERDGYFDQLQRSRAEFVNFRKRTDQERLKLAEIFTAETLKQFLPVLDDFERAGVQAVDSLNQPFDPAVHEAVATEPGTSGQTVVEVYQKGYKLGDTLLRAAMVKTGDAPESVGSTSTTTFDA